MSAVPIRFTAVYSWSDRARAVWGKTDPERGTWLPLVQHLADAADMAETLWREWVPNNLREGLGRAFGGQQVAGAVLVLLAAVHDLGKCAPAFQVKADRVPDYGFLVRELKRVGFEFPPKGAKLTPHGLLGQAAVQQLLESAGVQPGIARSVSPIIGSHHGSPTTRWEASHVPQIDLGLDSWADTRREIWHAMLDRAGLSNLPAVFAEPLPVPIQVQLNALVVMADWMSSNTELFPHEVVPNRLADALAGLDLPPRWSPMLNDWDPQEFLWARFARLGGASPQPLQTACVEAARSLDGPALLILEAPMGSGKTEAALMAAETMAARWGNGGVFVGLPTMATATPMFTRIADWLGQVPGADRTAVNLVHSKAALQPEFRELVSRSRFVGLADDAAETEVIVASWFRGRRRAALSTHVVGTIDQALFGALRAKHVMLRQLALAGKVVILDEVHAADDFMGVYLEDVLSWLAQHQVPVLLLSATLPPAKRNSLASAYATGRTRRPEKLELSAQAGYPRLSVVTDTASDWQVSQSERPASTVELVPMADDVPELVELLRQQLSHGGCAGVICSTVRRAQERFSALQQADLGEVVLLHSKFAAPHRAVRESDLVSRLGPNGDRPGRLIVVGTQVLEQSLDIDFDLLVADVAPMDLLFQRLGRLHRHQRGRPVGLTQPRCYLVGVEDWLAPPPQLAAGPAAVYRSWPLWSALAAVGCLPTRIKLPHDIPDLVALAYDEDREAPPGWVDQWSQALAKYRAERAKKENEARAFAIPTPDRARSLEDWADNLASDPEAPRTAARAKVRDADESLEVILIWKDAERNPRVLAGVERHSDALIPRPLGERDGGLARTVASCTVSLPRELTHPGVIEATIAALEAGDLDVSSWQTSPWLNGQLFLVLDSDGRASVGDTTLAYDLELGLRVVR